MKYCYTCLYEGAPFLPLFIATLACKGAPFLPPLLLHLPVCGDARGGPFPPPFAATGPISVMGKEIDSCFLITNIDNNLLQELNSANIAFNIHQILAKSNLA